MGAQAILDTGSLNVDYRDGIVLVVGSGFFTTSMIERHLEEVAAKVSLARRRAGAVKILVDLREASVQTADTMAQINAHSRTSLGVGDRVALVLHSTLARMQMNRTVDDRKHCTFDNIAAAMQWLAAE